MLKDTSAEMLEDDVGFVFWANAFVLSV
jgi:hypothetical protein